tara:strand:+ start:3303 stop:5687 length:2385 start_codon:yes stop_codon:yes gene_type:complete
MENRTNFSFEDESSFNIREILMKYLFQWKWFVVFLILSVVCGYISLRYSIPDYESKALILITDEDGGGLGGGGELSIFKDMGLLGGSSDVESEIDVLKSRSLINEVVKKLDLQQTHYIIGDNSGVKRGELMDNFPVKLSFLSADSLYWESEMFLELEFIDSQYILVSNVDFSKKIVFGDTCTTSAGDFCITKTAQFSDKWIGREIKFSLSRLEDVVTSIKNKVGIETTNKDGSVIAISLVGPNYTKNNQIIDELIRQHQTDAIADKNKVANNTNKFINDRIQFINGELSAVENESKAYKNKYQLVDVMANASQFMLKEDGLDDAVSKLNIQYSLSDYMLEILEKAKDKEALLPANLGFEDVTVSLMTQQYNELMLRKNKLLLNSSERNPVIVNLQNQLASIKSSLYKSLKNNKEALSLELQKLEKKQRIYQSKLSKVPQYEKEFRDIQRQQQIKEGLYLYLMEKREENQIRLAATIENTKVIDWAYSDRNPVSPKPKKIYLASIFLGLLVPFGIIYVRDLLDNKVHEIKDLEEFKLQGIGEIPEYQTENQIVVTKESRNLISEVFRSIRTNLNFLLTDKENGKVVAVTSTVAEEGKTFTSINLAHALSHTDKKTVLVCLDLRAPKFINYLKIEKDIGVSNYIADEAIQLEDILIPEEENPNLNYITSGPIPPNPAELLLRPRLEELINKLRQEFDYVIIDSAPIGLVSDTLNICEHIDLLLYIARANKAEKRFLSLPANLVAEKKVPKLAVLINRVNTKRNSSYGYGYGVGNSSYYESEDTASKKKRFGLNKRK